MIVFAYILVAGLMLLGAVSLIGCLALEWRFRKSGERGLRSTEIEIGFCLAFILILSLPACGEWYEYNPRGAKNNCGILEDVTSRTHDPQLNKFRNDKATWAHESTHCVNSDIANRVGGHTKAFYVGGGRAMVLAEPRISFADLDRHVTKYRNETYRHYIAQARSNDDRLDFLDEWTAYSNDLQCAVELKLRDDGNTDRATWFCYYAAAVLATVEDSDPHYAGLDDLREFVTWQTDRVRKLREKR